MGLLILLLIGQFFQSNYLPQKLALENWPAHVIAKKQIGMAGSKGHCEISEYIKMMDFLVCRWLPFIFKGGLDPDLFQPTLKFV